MSINESELRKEFGKTNYLEGRKLFEEGGTSAPVQVGPNIYSVKVTSGYRSVEFLVWDRGNGKKAVRAVGIHNGYGSFDVAALIACYALEDGPDTYDLLNRYTGDPLYEEHLSYGGLDDELDRLSDEIVDRFIDDVCRTDDPHKILDTLDKAIDDCYSNRECDTIPLGRKLESRAKKLNQIIREAKPIDISAIINSSDRIFSRKWLARSNLSDAQAMMAFVDLSDRKSLNTYDLTILSILSRKVDPENYAEAVTDGLGYYEMERMALRELRRGHRDIAVAISKRFSDAEDFDVHLSEAGRLRQDFGLKDEEDVFVKAFVNDPNEKRLLDLVANHTDLDMDQVLENAWTTAGHTPTNLIFFARNGFEEKVSSFLTRNTDWVMEHMYEDVDTLQLLGEVLKDRKQYNVSADLLIRILEDCMHEKGSEDIAVHIMNVLDSEYDDALSVLEPYCRNFRKKHGNKVLWNMYGSGGHF
ncbi:MAG: hypothetical protein MJZ68_08040 [archaeon]|nr:hypothetical protein [archaeon]